MHRQTLPFSPANFYHKQRDCHPPATLLSFVFPIEDEIEPILEIMDGSLFQGKIETWVVLYITFKWLKVFLSRSEGLQVFF
jgi:hypothetical protein